MVLGVTVWASQGFGFGARRVLALPGLRAQGLGLRMFFRLQGSV